MEINNLVDPVSDVVTTRLRCIGHATKGVRDAGDVTMFCNVVRQLVYK